MWLLHTARYLHVPPSGTCFVVSQQPPPHPAQEKSPVAFPGPKGTASLNGITLVPRW